jgi:choice-of-anchor A domain-containing protein
LNQYNLITLGDLSTSSDVEFETLVCGSLTSSSSANFAIHMDQSTSSSTAVLQIAQSLAPGSAINVQVGSVSLGQSTNTIVKQGNVQYTVNNNRPFNINGGNQGGQVVCDSTLIKKCQGMTQELQDFSLLLSQRTPNNIVTIPTSQPGPLNFNILTTDSDGFAFFLLFRMEIQSFITKMFNKFK